MTQALRGNRRLALGAALIVFTVAYVMFVSMPARAWAQDDETPVNMEETAKSVKEKVSAPLLTLGIISLVFSAVFYMFARGNPEPTRKARMAIAASIVGILIALNAGSIISFLRGLIKFG